jgi:2',3'-cyclic-nucleotide 2'-phosphodiesterase (5'-nucleotidase family)
MNDDRKLARSFPEIDLIVGGHSHTFLESGLFEGETLIVQAGYRGDFIGEVELLWDEKEKKVVSKKARLIEVDPNKGVDNKVREAVDSFKKIYDQELSEPVFESKEIIIGQRNRSNTLELPLGNLICDALRSEMKTDIAFFNSGGIRSNLPKGVVTKRDILEAFPFRNTVATGTLRGREVVALLNEGVNRGKFGGGVLQVSGLRYEIKEGKVSRVWAGENPIHPNKTYTFATNSYVISAGDKLKTMKRAKNIAVSTMPIDQPLVQFLKALSFSTRNERARIIGGL